jgi:Arf-GAP/coiled-coil/ANK repeat/PH domain-containing protein
MLRGVPGNARCADCGAAAPEWASLNLCCLLCLQCSGVHRALGVHVSKVRSLSLDTRAWEPAVMTLMAAGGNAAVNAVLEAAPGAADAKPTPGAGGDAAAAFIRAKYERRAWVAPSTAAAAPAALARAVAMGDAHAALAALLAGAPPDAPASRGFSFVEVDRSDDEGSGSAGSSAPRSSRRSVRYSQGGGDSPTALVAAAQRAATGRSLLHCAAADADVALTELLLLHGARVDPLDADGRSPLHLACVAAARQPSGSAGAECARRLLRAGADARLRDDIGLVPADLAIARATQRVADAALDAALREASAPVRMPPPPVPPLAEERASPAAGRPPAGRHRRMGSMEFITRELGSMFNRNGNSGRASGGGDDNTGGLSSSGPASAPPGGLGGTLAVQFEEQTQQQPAEEERTLVGVLGPRRTYSLPRAPPRAPPAPG